MIRASLLLGAPATPTETLSLLAKGFRPFFLLAALYAVLSVALWLAVLQGAVRVPGYLEPITWHAHEMLFGFTAAVIAGFLLTAVGNWTGRETATGSGLAALALLWLAGRAAMWLSGVLPRGLPALVDAAFLPALAITLARPLIATGNRRNFVMVGILGALSAGNLAVHAEALGLLANGSARRAHLLSVELIALLMSVIGGRVIPMFTRNATGVQTIRSNRALDLAANLSLVALIVVDFLAPAAVLASSILAALAGVLAIARAVSWGGRYALREPLLWILHAGQGWLALGLLLRGAGALMGFASGSASTHAITAGAIGSLTLGMMARVALGHTGRMLVAPKAMSAAFLLITLSAALRVSAPIAWPELLVPALLVAGSCWAAAFTLFLFCYARILMQPRVDGRPG